MLLLLLCFPRRPDIVAAAWGILAIGDGLATLAGRALGGPRWPWNPDKTVSGSVAFAAGGASAAVVAGLVVPSAAGHADREAFHSAGADRRGDHRGLVETIPVRAR